MSLFGFPAVPGGDRCPEPGGPSPPSLQPGAGHPAGEPADPGPPAGEPR